MKLYRTHYCTKKHQSYATLAKCLWPRASFRSGDGPYALISKCRRGCPTVTMHRDARKATETLRDLNAAGCGGRCTRNHELIEMAGLA